MKNIAIIGAGQLGSRHLQALAGLDGGASIQVVDPSPKSLQVAQERYLQVDNGPQGPTVQFLTDIGGLSPQIDFCVVATGADVRYRVLESLLASRQVTYLLLEKVLFQSVAELEAAGDLLRKSGASAWVNCPRRLYPFYASLKEKTAPVGDVRYAVTGGEWGMACNAIHFLDHLAWLVEDELVSLDFSGLERTIHQSKRPGFIEVFGTLRGRFSRGAEIELTATRGATPAPRLTVVSSGQRLDVDETSREAFVRRETENWREEKVTFDLPFQSALTHLVVQDLSAHGSCGLTPFDESARLHRVFLEGLTAFLEEVSGHGYPRCPIT